jgi:8-oxo-dGTP pyrophosphatase MutT (NUDIX family)
LVLLDVREPFFQCQNDWQTPYPYHGYITGKIRWGEEVLETAKREIFEETGMTANKLTLVGVEHKRDYAKNGDLLEDKYFFVIRAEDFDTEDFKKYEGGESLWVDKEEISKLPNLFDDMDALMEMFEGNKFSFTEPKYTVKSY